MSNDLVKFEEIIPVKLDEDINEDLRQSRIDIKEVAAIGIQAVSEAAQLASQSQNHLMYHALSHIMRSTLEANRELVENHRARRQFEEENQGLQPGNVTNQLILNASTEEIIDMLTNKNSHEDV